MSKRYLGIDLHRNVFTVCIRYDSGRSRLEEWSISSLKLFSKKLKNSDEVAVEATGRKSSCRKEHGVSKLSS